MVIAGAVMGECAPSRAVGRVRLRAARAVDGQDRIARTGRARGRAVRVRQDGERRQSGPTGRAREVAEVDVAAPGQHVALSDDLGPGHATHGRRRNRCGQPHPRVDGRGGAPLPFSQGHECQRQAPARWSATLLRGGVLRVTTWPSWQPRRQARTLRVPVSEKDLCDDAHPRPPRLRLPRLDPPPPRRRGDAGPAGHRRHRRVRQPRPRGQRAGPGAGRRARRGRPAAAVERAPRRGLPLAGQHRTAGAGPRVRRRVRRGPRDGRRGVHPQHHRRAEPAGHRRPGGRAVPRRRAPREPAAVAVGARRRCAPDAARGEHGRGDPRRAGGGTARHPDGIAHRHRGVQRHRRGAAAAADRRDRPRGRARGSPSTPRSSPRTAASTSPRPGWTTSRSPGTSSTRPSEPER